MFNIVNVIEESKYKYIDKFIKENISNFGLKDTYSLIIYNINKTAYNNIYNNIYNEQNNNRNNINFGILPIKILNLNNTFINIKYSNRKKEKIKSTLINFIENFNIKKYDIYFSNSSKLIYINIINNYDLTKIRHESLGDWKDFYLFFKKSNNNEHDNNNDNNDNNDNFSLLNIINNESCKNLNKILTDIKFNENCENHFFLEDGVSGIII